MKLSGLYATMTALLMSMTSVGQNLKGTIVDSENEPIANAVITILETNTRQATTIDGAFEIAVPNGTIHIKVTHLGHRTTERTITESEKAKTVVIQMTHTSENLAEVTVNGSTNRYAETKSSLSLRVQSPIIDQPQNIQVIERQTLLDQGNLNMMDGVIRNVSGTQMLEHWGSFARIHMRGFKIPAFRNGMNVDMPWGPLSEDMAMVDRIEFVKGPAGFMATAGEPGGFYNIVTKKPVANPTQSIDFNMGSFNLLRTAVDVGGAVNNHENLTYRFNAMASTSQSYRDYDYTNRYTINPTIGYKIDDKTTLTAEYIFQHAEMAVLGSAYIFSPGEFGDLPRDWSVGEPNIDPTKINEHNAFVSLDHQLNSNWNVHAQVGYMNYVQYGSSIWPSTLDSAGTLQRTLSIFDALNEAYLGQAFVQGKAQTGGVTHKILAGLDFQQKNYFADWSQSGNLGGPIDVYNPTRFVSTSDIPVFDRTLSIRQRAYGFYAASQTNQTAAIFAQDELGFLQDRVLLTLGGRLTSYAGSTYGASVENTAFTPRVGLNVQVTDYAHVYGLFDQSFLPQTGSDVNGDAFVPVEATDLEGGVKTKFFDGKWNASAGYFHMTKNNVLTSDPDNPMFSIQLGQVVSKGIEVDIQGEILPGLSVILNYANTDVRITEDTDESMIGTKLAGYAEHQTNGWLNYRFNNKTLKGFNISMGYQYQANRSTWGWTSTNESLLPNYFRLDGALGWSNDKFSVNLNINNLLNDYLYSGASYGSYVYWQSEPGTNFRLNFQYRF